MIFAQLSVRVLLELLGCAAHCWCFWEESVVSSWIIQVISRLWIIKLIMSHWMWAMDRLGKLQEEFQLRQWWVDILREIWCKQRKQFNLTFLILGLTDPDKRLNSRWNHTTLKADALLWYLRLSSCGYSQQKLHRCISQSRQVGVFFDRSQSSSGNLHWEECDASESVERWMSWKFNWGADTVQSEGGWRVYEWV